VSPADMDIDDPLAPFRARFDAFYEDPTTGQNTHSIYNSQGDVLKAYVDDAIQKGGWAVRELHGIEDNYWGSVSLAKYRQHLDYVATKVQSNKIWMDTFSNVTRYRASRTYCGDATAENGAIIFSMDSSVGCTQYATPLSVIVTVTGVDAIKVTQNAVELPVKPLGSEKYLLEIDPIAGPAYVTSSGCGVEDFKLHNNSWRQISLPCRPPTDANTVSSFFQDDDLGVYDESWVVYRYDSTNNDYVKLAVDDTFSQKIGYWIIQKSGHDKHLSLPENSIPTPVANSTGCARSATGCIEIPLVTRSTAIQWNMTSYPFRSSGSMGDVRVLTDSGTCASGCEMDVAKTEGIVHNQLWTYKGTGYALVTTSDNLDPWTGYWATSLASADGTNPRLLLAKP
ncbi:MAG: hypothetical protein KAG66_09250, partial [Methylococcales bacterium]|nr:hypothetical protein [Methylococcales bacterium]